MSLKESNTSDEKLKERQAFREKMEAQLREWTAKIDQLKAKTDQSKADAKIEYHQRINELREKRKIMQGRLDDLKGASDDAWESLKTGVRKAGDDLKNAVENAVAKFK